MQLWSDCQYWGYPSAAAVTVTIYSSYTLDILQSIIAKNLNDENIPRSTLINCDNVIGLMDNSQKSLFASPAREITVID